MLCMLVQLTMKPSAFRKKSGATAVVLGNTESDAIRSLLNVLIKRKERTGVTWKARELKEYRK